MLSTQPACPVGSINSTHSIQHKFHHKQHRIGVVSAHAHATSELLQDAAPAASTIGPSLAARTAAYNTIQVGCHGEVHVGIDVVHHRCR